MDFSRYSLQALFQDQVLVVLIQSLKRTLLTQRSDGNWGLEDLAEENAYCILTLLALLDLLRARSFTSNIPSAIQAGRQV